jgi:surface carbohydrate biosynthesis protein
LSPSTNDPDDKFVSAGLVGLFRFSSMTAKNHGVSKSLIIPVEIQHREFLAKLHMAAAAAARGCEVFIGNQAEITRRLSQFPNSLYLDKSIDKAKFAHFKRLHSFGHVPVALCEEGLAYRNAEAYRRERIHAPCFDLVERFYMWGRHQLADVEAVVGKSPRLKVAGNPRFDLLRPEMRRVWQAEAEEIRSEFGNFVLINTNFSRANRVEGIPDVVEVLKKRGTLGGDGNIAFYRGWVEHLDRIRRHFLDMVPELARALSPCKVLIRPHPGENHESWKKAAEGLENVRVVHRGSAIPWMMGARAVVHNSCTTGVEAWILDRPVFAYMPVTSDTYDSELPNELSERHDSLSGLKQALRLAVERQNGAAKGARRENLADYYIEGIHGKFATDIIVSDLIDNCEVAEKSAPIIPALYETAHRTARRLPGLRVPAGLRYLKKQKFPGIGVDEVNSMLGVLAGLRPELGSAACERHRKVPDVFRIY